jgi:hypothetical protein
MEYLMTYGWAILIVAVVLGALYSLGVFGGSNFLGGTCIAAPGYLCSNPLLATDGTLSFTYGYQGPNVTVVGFACTNTTTAPSSFASSGSSILEPGQEESASVSCPLSSSATIGTPYSGYLWVEYDQAGQSNLIARFATIRTSVSLGSTSGVTSYVICAGDANIAYQSVYNGVVTGNGITWGIGAGLPSPGLSYSSCDVYNGYIYCAAGYADSGNYVYSGSIASNDIVTWHSTTSYPLPTANPGPSCSEYGGYMYCVGGGSGTTAVYYSQMSSGGLGPWIPTTNTLAPLETNSCNIYNGYIYCVDAASSPYNSVEYAPLESPGVGAWSYTTNFPAATPSWEMADSCFTNSNYLYCTPMAMHGGSTGNYIYYTSMSSSGVGAWSATSNIPDSHGIDLGDCFTTSTDAYCIEGNYYSANNGNVVYAPFKSGGGLGSWSRTNSYPLGSSGAGMTCGINGDTGGFGN